MTVIRPLTMDDAPALAKLVAGNRDFLSPWEPLRDESFFTLDGQRAAVKESLAHRDQGTVMPHVIVDDDGQTVGRIGLHGIVAAPSFLSCSVGYWVASEYNGRGHATAALRQVLRVAFTGLGLHRVQAETLVHNE